jgi:hypothetical protein
MTGANLGKDVKAALHLNDVGTRRGNNKIQFSFQQTRKDGKSA